MSLKDVPEIKISDSSIMLPELKVYNHALSPLPMQNPFKRFATHITTNLVPNIVEKNFCLPQI